MNLINQERTLNLINIESLKFNKNIHSIKEQLPSLSLLHM